MSKRRWGTLLHRRGRWRARFRVDGKVRERSFADKTLAEEFLERMARESEQAVAENRQPRIEISWTRFSDEYLRYARTIHRPSTIAVDVQRLAVIGRAWGERLLTSITPADVERLLESLSQRRKSGVSVATRNRYRSQLLVMFNRAIALGYLDTNPVKAAKIRERQRAIPYLTPLQQDALIAAQPRQTHDLVLVARGTGMRRGELLGLSWSDVRFDTRKILVGDPKNGHPREVPMSEEVFRCLEARRQTDDRVFPEWPAPEKETYAARDELLRTFRRGCKKVGVRLRFHDLRHIAAVNFIRAGVPMPDVMRIMGWHSLAMVERYACHAPVDAAAQAVRRLEEFLQRARDTSARRDPTQTPST